MNEPHIHLIIIETVIIMFGVLAISYSVWSLNRDVKEHHEKMDDPESRLISGGHKIYLDDEYTDLCRKAGIVSKHVMLNILEKEVEYCLIKFDLAGLSLIHYKYSEGFFLSMGDLKMIESQDLHKLNKICETKIPLMDDIVVQNIGIHLIAVKS